jgi:hypothetical protein
MNLNKVLKSTVDISLVAQLITGIIDLYAMTFNYNGDKLLLKGLIGIEVFVQFIELIFYVWLAMSINTEKNITPKRYYDWMITTPSMLFIFIVYLEYLRNGNKIIKPEEETINWTTIDYLWHSFDKHSNDFYFVIVLNFLMLFFGYLGEINIMSTINSVACGFLPFIVYFYFIYEKYAKYSTRGIILFAIFAILWALYGVAALMPYTVKNIGYNILDIFSKNFFGLFLVYIALFE